MRYELLIRFKADAVHGAHIRDYREDGKTPGPARAIQPADIADYAPEINLGSLARIAELTEEIEALKIAHAEEIARLTAPPETVPVLTRLGEVYGQLPDVVQVAFADLFAVVRILCQTGRQDLAAARVAAASVPEGLEETQAQIVAMLRGE